MGGGHGRDHARSRCRANGHEGAADTLSISQFLWLPRRNEMDQGRTLTFVAEEGVFRAPRLELSYHAASRPAGRAPNGEAPGSDLTNVTETQHPGPGRTYPQRLPHLRVEIDRDTGATRTVFHAASTTVRRTDFGNLMNPRGWAEGQCAWRVAQGIRPALTGTCRLPDCRHGPGF